MLRRLIETAGGIQEMAYAAEDAVDETLDRAEAAIFEVAERRVADTIMPLHPALEETLDQLEALYDRDRATSSASPPATTTSTRCCSACNRRRSRSSRPVPGQGKTSLALGMAQHVALRRAQAGALLLDGDGLPRAHEATARGRGASRTSRKLQTGKLSEHEWPRVNQAIGRLAEAPFFIDDNPHCTVMEMRAKARRIKARYGDLGLIVVDYLQLMSTPGRVGEPPGRGLGAVARAEDPRPRARGAGR